MTSVSGKYCCPTCGHPWLPTDPLAILGPTERRYFTLIYNAGSAGILRDDLRNKVYDGTKGGASSSLIGVVIHKINRKIGLFNLAISGNSRGGWKKKARYTLVSTKNNHFHIRKLRSKLTEQDIRAIRASRDLAKQLAWQYSVSQNTIHRIRARRTWKHVR